MKRWKSIIAVLMSICLIAAAFLGTVGSAIAADTTADAELTVSSVQGYEGDTVTVTVAVTNNQGLASLGFRVGFDTSVLEFVEAAGPDSIFSGSIIMNEDVTDYVGYSYANTQDVKDNGVILTIKFKIVEGAELGVSSFDIYSYGMDEGEIDATYTDKEDKNKTQQAVIKLNNGGVEVLCNHKVQKNVVKEEATCTKPGLEETICERCNTVLDTKKIEATGHSFGEYTVTKEATCTEAGEKVRVCSKCGEEEKVEIPMTEHVAGNPEVTVEPTCEEAGESVIKCTVCGNVISKNLLEALGHKYDSYTIKKEVSQTEDGLMERTCMVCGKTESIVLPKLESVKPVIMDGAAENPLPEQHAKGEEIIFTAVGIGMDNLNPQAGDVRYVPASWSINPSGEWAEAPYTAAFTIDEAGEYELTVVYNREIYSDGKWVADGNTVTSETAVIISETPETVVPDTDANTDGMPADSEKNDSVATGDTAVYVILFAAMLMLASASTFAYFTKRARS